MSQDYDVAIIGAGITGCSIARWLSKYDLKIIVIEKHNDVASGTTKANSGIIHAGYSAKKGTLKEEFNVKGNPMFDQAVKELKFEFNRIGSFVVAVEDEQISDLKKEKKRADKRGIPSEILYDIRVIKTMEPNISDRVKAVFYAPTAGIVWPMGLCLALAENAHENGVNFLLSCPVTEIKNNKEYFAIKAGNQEIKTKYIVNAAGLFADKIANMVGLHNYTITPRKGEYILLDKAVLQLSHILFPIPTKVSKGILVCPTMHGNTFIGPNSNFIDNKDDTSTSSTGLNEVIDGARQIFPGVPIRAAVCNFAGLRAISNHRDFIVGESKVNGFINAAGICSPGLSSCLSIAERVVEILEKDVGVKLIKKSNYNPNRIPPKRLINMNERQISKEIKNNPQWGRVICRCETVTEAEIVDAINRPLGARSFDMIKMRLRPGMGRCQGAFCTPKIIKILSRELKIPMEQVQKGNKGSEFVIGRSKNLKSIIWEGQP